MMGAAWTHDRLQRDLLQRRRAARNTAAWAEVEIPGTDGGRFDVFAERRHDARQESTFIGYEVKASANDLESDLASGKWRRYLPACDEFYFAVPADLTELASMAPAPCGLFVRTGTFPGGSWRTARKAEGGHRTVSEVAVWRRLALREMWKETERPSRSRLERMEEYLRMSELSSLVSGRIAQELRNRELSVAYREREVMALEHRMKATMEAEGRASAVAPVVETLAEVLRGVASSVDLPWGAHGVADRDVVDEAVRLIVSAMPAAGAGK